MKKEKLLLFTCIFIPLVLGAFFGYTSSEMTPKLNISSITYQSSIETEIINKNMGAVSLSKLKGSIGDIITLKITPKESYSHHYQVGFLFFNEQEIALNYNHIYLLTLKEGTNKLKVVFIDEVTAEEKTKKPELKKENDNVKFTFSYNEELLTNSPCQMTYQTFNAFDIENITLNNKLILPNDNNQYCFLLEKNENIIDYQIIKGVANDDEFNNFIEKYPTLENIDFYQEISKNNLPLSQLIHASYVLTSNEEYIYSLSLTTALSKALLGITNEQKVASSYIKNQDQFFKENITSSSLVNMAERSYLDSSITYYRSQKVNNFKAEYQDSTTYSVSDYLAKYHLNVDDILNYPLKSNYILPSSTMNKIDDGYQFNIDLDLNAVINYANYMITTTEGNILASQTSIPSFKNVELSIKVDKNLRFLEVDSIENYVVHSSFGDAETVGTGHKIFTYEKKEIPSIETAIDYGEVL